MLRNSYVFRFRKQNGFLCLKTRNCCSSFLFPCRQSNIPDMTSETYMPGPMCLIENMEGQLVVKQEALQILSAITQPMVVVAIVGIYSTGKSYLMNQLAGKKKGFSVDSTVQSHTKGIWMWCVPHPEKPGHTLVLLDAEGLGDVEKDDDQNDTQIFALAILLSSTFVYNDQGTIYLLQFGDHGIKYGLRCCATSAGFLNQLSYVTELTDLLRARTSPDIGVGDADDNVSFFPDLVWTLRDFYLSLEIDGQLMTADEYLENSVKTKQDNWTSVLGKSLENLVLTYVNTINSADLPCMENAVLALAQRENAAAIKKALAHYDQLMGQKVQLPTETLQELLDLHRASEKEILLDAKQKFICKQNKEASLDRCSTLFQDIFGPLEEAVKQGIYSKPGGHNLYLQKTGAERKVPSTAQERNTEAHVKTECAKAEAESLETHRQNQQMMEERERLHQQQIRQWK
ncbi:Hypothetical predicted protein [Marmota monax]|uniref:GB1/RHD3-type G domain-containing protein n=1 Tax=Marmota monax TaxID=9995 RepID=A0A5E4D0F8_MARMO|nr:Hypothetical predicted protein [Marmota monax]